MARFIERWRQEIDKTTRRQAWLGVAVGLFVLAGAATLLIRPGIYPAGDPRGDAWFTALTVALLTFFALWALIPCALRLRRP